MPDGSHSKVKLNVRVPPSKKAEWKDALQEGETLTSLVQRAVDREVRDEYVPRQAIEDVRSDGELDVDLSDVTTKIDDLKQTVNVLQIQIDDLSTPGTTPDEERVSELAMELVPHIPLYDDVHPDLRREIGESGDEPLDGLKTAIEYAHRHEPEKQFDGSAYTIADAVDEEEVLVRQALIYLERRTTEKVSSVVADGTRHWIRGVA